MKQTTRRDRIATFGSYGSTVNVFADMLGDEPVARVEWRERKRRHTRTFRGAKRDREASAKAFAKGTAERLAGPVVREVKRLSVGELWDAYWTANAPDWRRKTQVLAKSRWQVFVLFVDPSLPADLVLPETLDEWRKVLLETKTKTGQPMARNQVAHHIQLVKSVWRFGRKRKLLTENLLADYEVKKGRDYQALEVPEFTPEQWAKIIDQFDFRDSRAWRPWAAIALDGLLAPRSNAMLNVQWPDISGVVTEGPRTITWRGETDKLGKTRVQPLPRDAVLILRVCRVWARRQGYTGDFVFYGVQARTKGTHWTYSALNRQLDLACQRADVPRVKYQSMHALRRMRAGSVLEATGDITKAGDWLGDEDVRVMRKSYLRKRTNHLAGVVAGISLPASDKTGNETATDATKAPVDTTGTR